MKREDLQFFDPKADWNAAQRALPHWSQPAAITFITCRLADSMPNEVLDRLESEIAILLRSEGFDPDADYERRLSGLSAKKRAEVYWKLFATRDKYLDQGLGECRLAIPEFAELVLESLLHFEDRYFVTDAVIMPNHVHFLCAFASDTEMLKQCTEWKRYTGRQINQRFDRTGELWQVDQFDHLIRGPEDFDRYRCYIAENPRRAGLKAVEYRHFQKAL